MKYERMATQVEAMQYTGDVDAVRKFCIAHSDPNKDDSNRQEPTRHSYSGADGYFIEIWVEKSSAYCRIDVGDYVVAEAIGYGVYPHHREGFERTHIPLLDGHTPILHARS